MATENLQINIGANVNEAVAGIKQVEKGIHEMDAAMYQARYAGLEFTHIIRDIPFAISNPRILSGPFDRLIQTFSVLKQETGSTSGAFGALLNSLKGGGGLLIAATTAVTLFTLFADKLFKTKDASDEAEKSLKKTEDALNGFYREAAQEGSKVAGLVGVLQSENETRYRKIEALKELKKINFDIFGQLTLEGNAVAGLDEAYKRHLENLRTVIAVKVKQSELEDLITKQLKLQGLTMTESEKRFDGMISKTRSLLSTGEGGSLNVFGQLMEKGREKTQKELKTIEDNITAAYKSIQDLSKGISVGEPHEHEKKIKDLRIKIEKLLKENPLHWDVVPGEDPFRFNLITDPLKSAMENGVIQPERTGKQYADAFTSGYGNAVSTVIEQWRAKYLDLAKSMPHDPLKIGEEEENLKKLMAVFNAVDWKKAFDKGLAPSSIGDDYKKVFDQLRKSVALQGMKKDLVDIRSVAEGVAGAFGNIFDAMLNGENIIKSIGNAIKQVVIDLIKAAIQAFVFNKVLGVLSGGTSTAGGLNLAPGFFTFASGGLVYGPSLGMVGEGQGTSRANPEVIAPLDKLRSMLGGMNNSNGFQGEVKIKGNDLVLAIARTQKIQSR